MKKKLILFTFTFLLMALSLVGNQAIAGPLNPAVTVYMQSLKEEAKKDDPGFRDFTAERGKEFYYKEFPHPEDPKKRSCGVCHTKDAKTKGSHYDTGKPIEPLAPSITPERLTEVKKIKKWFKRNCKWVMQGPCNAREKGDFITYLLSL